MSDQAIAERVELDKKDKTELQAIVAALGGKSSSRTKKADLIESILQLSGVISGQPDEADPLDDEEIDAPEVHVTPVVDSEDSDSGDSDSGDSDSDSDFYSADPGPAAVAPSVDSGRQQSGRQGSPRQGSSRQESPRQESGQGSSRQGSNQQGRPSSEQQGSPRQGSTQPGPNQSGGSQQNPNQQNPNQQNPNQQNPNQQPGVTNQDGEDGESGNRRRRRRGRGRDRDDLIEAPSQEAVSVAGFLDLRDDGYGFLRVNGLLPSADDVYVPVKMARQYGLRRGDLVAGSARPANRNEKNPALQQLDTINGVDPESLKDRPDFDRMTAHFPDERLRLERTQQPLDLTPRIIDLLSPIGKGQRGLIVSPPKAGKTTILKEIATSIEVNHPEVELVVLLIDERPEEVTDMTRHLERGEVIASTFDRPIEEHCAIAELTLERAKRVVEEGKDVVILLDGITRLARAYNMAASGNGRTLSGGVDAGALFPPKKFLGAARNLEEGGSLTILATARIDTGSRMDEVIFEEFEGTGNMELRLDRGLSERFIHPAIDALGSSTRRDELLMDEPEAHASAALRKMLAGLAGNDEGSAAAAMTFLVDRLRTFTTNEAFLREIASSR